MASLAPDDAMILLTRESTWMEFSETTSIAVEEQPRFCWHRSFLIWIGSWRNLSPIWRKCHEPGRTETCRRNGQYSDCRRTHHPRSCADAQAARARRESRARSQHSTAVGRRIPCLRPDSHAPTKTLGRLRARPRGSIRYRDRARQIDLRVFGLVSELSCRQCLYPGAFPGRGATRCLEPRCGCLHRDLGGADRQSGCGARRLPARRLLVVVQRAAPFAMDHDWRARLSRERRSSRHAAVRGAGGASEAGGYLVLCGIDRERLQHLGARQRL